MGWKTIHGRPFVRRLICYSSDPTMLRRTNFFALDLLSVSASARRWAALFVVASSRLLLASDNGGDETFRSKIEPVLSEYCYDCHAEEEKKGKVSFDDFKSHDELFARHDLWLAVLKNVRAGLMPPEKKPRPSEGERQILEAWIKSAVFKIDPQTPDAGRVTIRRLNRVEYRNTIRDLTG